MIDGRAIDALFKFTIVYTIISFPLALWKLIDILIWLYNNVHIGLK
jgi:hypothetical protein